MMERTDQAAARISVSARLTQFYWQWFQPIVIDGQGLAVGTDLGYQSLLAWWVRLTPDPPLAEIDEFCVANFAAKLRSATYRRGPAGKERPLSPHRVSILLRCLRALLNRAGAQREPSKQTAALELKVPVVPVTDPGGDPKPSFTLDEALRILSAARRIGCPRVDELPPWRFWRGLLAAYYVTGLRRGDLLSATWPQLRDDGQHRWLIVPERKTGKSKRTVIPPWLWHELSTWPQGEGPIFAWPHHVDHLNDVHYELQTLAGIPRGEQLSIQGWRRTHATAMSDVGFHRAEELSAGSMQHADRATTRRFYVDVENRARLLLPPLWEPPPPGDPRQGRLFD